MSTWRKKTIECLPEDKKDLESPDTNIYIVFGYMLAALRIAHSNNDNEKLKKIYAFAAWCFKQKEKHLWNASGVAFYEHLGDHQVTLDQIHNWVSKEIYSEIRELLQLRISDDNLKALDRKYAK
jgi:hypothetical protein